MSDDDESKPEALRKLAESLMLGALLKHTVSDDPMKCAEFLFNLT